jgi:TraX protein
MYNKTVQIEQSFFMVNNMKKYQILNSFHLKLAAILFMTIDHIGYIFQLTQAYRIIGRLAFPLFAFMIYQGFRYTRNRLKYASRLLIFGILIELGLVLIGLFMPIPLTTRNIFLLLGFGVLGLMILETNRMHYMIKTVLIAYLAYLATVFQFDYDWYGFLLILSFIFYPKYSTISFLIQIILTYLMIYFGGMDIQYYALFAWGFILLYNGKKGYPLNKYIFYWYYPLHLGILYLLAEYL